MTIAAVRTSSRVMAAPPTNITCVSAYRPHATVVSRTIRMRRLAPSRRLDTDLDSGSTVALAALGAADGDPRDQDGWHAHAHRHALAVFAAGPAAVGELVVA